ncbi:Uncharacterized protein TCM_029634 [Theobroma cacao]|uniref:Uncharacterized protein n=1 Tax=Theobroma cacao TaxID=3641 RepID=A0A061GDF2_THECC|nr:Uncharacterized protein TCM_029634 [Theobroma cacao]
MSSRIIVLILRGKFFHLRRGVLDHPASDCPCNLGLVPQLLLGTSGRMVFNKISDCLDSKSVVVQWLGCLAFTQETRVRSPATESFADCFIIGCLPSGKPQIRAHVASYVFLNPPTLRTKPSVISQGVPRDHQGVIKGTFSHSIGIGDSNFAEFQAIHQDSDSSLLLHEPQPSTRKLRVTLLTPFLDY